MVFEAHEAVFVTSKACDFLQRSVLCGKLYNPPFREWLATASGNPQRPKIVWNLLLFLDCFDGQRDCRVVEAFAVVLPDELFHLPTIDNKGGFLFRTVQFDVHNPVLIWRNPFANARSIGAVRETSRDDTRKTSGNDVLQ